MAKEYLKKTVNRTAKPRSKRLQDLGSAAPSSATSIIQTAGGTGGASAGSGHSHTNLPTLEQIGTDKDGYAYLTQSKENEDGSVSKTTEKVRAGYADEAGHAEDSDKWGGHAFDDYMDQAVKKGSDVQFNEVLLKILASKEFMTGIDGWHIDEKGNAEMRSLTLRDSLRVPELRFNRMTYFEGYNVISPGGGFTIRTVVDNGNGTYSITTDAEEGEPVGQYVDDILTGYWHNFNGGNSDIQGFGKMQFRVTAVDYDSGVVTISPKPAAEVEELAVPIVNLKLAQTGNFTNTERQTFIILDVRDGNCCITFMDQVNTWEPEAAHVKSWLGRKKGAKINGQDVGGYNAVLQNVYMSGLIHQIDQVTGESVRVPIDKGAWKSGTSYGYYNRVSHKGALWLCISETATTAEPSDSSTAWLKQVSEGKQGEQGAPGQDGKDGVNGKDGENGKDGKDGVNGSTPYVQNGTWWINGVDTGHKALGVDGKDGANGKDGVNGTDGYTPYIQNGTWWIAGVDTGVKASGTDGKDGSNGKDGKDGSSVSSGGTWNSSRTPYQALTIVTMGGHAWISNKATSNPPMYIVTDKDGNRMLGADGGYILTGEVNTADWSLVISDSVVIYLVSNVGSVIVSETTGMSSMSAFKVTAKQNSGDTILSYSSGYLVCKGVKSDGTLGAKAGPKYGCEIIIDGIASDSYNDYIVRCYKVLSDAQSWNDNFSAEISIGKIVQPRSGSEPRPRGLIKAGTTYVWNEKFHDIGYYSFGGVTHAFRVKLFGAEVTAVPTSVNGDDNWEPAQEFQFVATDLLLADDVVAERIFSRHIEVNDMEILDGCKIGTDIRVENGKVTSESELGRTEMGDGHYYTRTPTVRNPSKYYVTEIGGCSGTAMMVFGGDDAAHCSMPYIEEDGTYNTYDCGYYASVSGGLAAWFSAGQVAGLRPLILRAKRSTTYIGDDDVPDFATVIVAAYTSGVQYIYLPSSPQRGAYYKIINDYSRGSRALYIVGNGHSIETSSGTKASIIVSNRAVVEVHFDGSVWHSN